MPISSNAGVYRVGAQYGVLRQQLAQTSASPRDPTLALWLQRSTGMFTDVSATTIANTNDPVAAWRDADTLISATQGTLGARPTRQAGGELLFDGADRLLIPEANSRAQIGWTVAGWAMRTGSNATQSIVARDSNSNPNRDWVLDNGASGHGLRVWNSSGTLHNAIVALGLTGWSFVIGVIEASTIRAYVNGAEVATAAFSGTPRVSAITTGIGANTSNADRNFTGSIGDVRIWTRALSAAEIAALWTAERTSYGV